MGLKKSLLKGIVACIVVTAVARAVGGERPGTKVGLLTGGSVAVGSWLSDDGVESEVEIEYDATAE